MFGYIMPEKPELKIKEFDVYKAYYCGICKSMGKRYGQLPRMTLTYDAAFMAMLFCSLAGVQTKLVRERCIVHPLKKSFVNYNEIMDYCSDINIILAYNNIKDKWLDDRSKIALTGLVTMKKVYKKLMGKYPEKCAIINQRLEELAMLEKAGCASIDAAAEPFAKLMEEVMDFDRLEADSRKALRWMGYNLGKWIYIIDAFDDLEEDVKNSSFNPLISHFKYNGQDICKFKGEIREQVEFILLYCLGEASKAYELLDKKENKGILENILYMGMLSKTDKILCQRSCVKGEESI